MNKIAYKTIVTIKPFILNGQQHITQLTSDEVNDIEKAEAFGKALIEAGVAIGYRVCDSSRPEEINGWYMTNRVSYIPEEYSKIKPYLIREVGINVSE